MSDLTVAMGNRQVEAELRRDLILMSQIFVWSSAVIGCDVILEISKRQNLYTHVRARTHTQH